jgi:hypothetical protein
MTFGMGDRALKYRHQDIVSVYWDYYEELTRQTVGQTLG